MGNRPFDLSGIGGKLKTAIETAWGGCTVFVSPPAILASQTPPYAFLEVDFAGGLTTAGRTMRIDLTATITAVFPTSSGGQVLSEKDDRLNDLYEALRDTDWSDVNLAEFRTATPVIKAEQDESVHVMAFVWACQLNKAA